MNEDILITGSTGYIGRCIKGGRSYLGVPFDFREIRGIVHLAAKSNVRKCEEDPRECIDSNLFFLDTMLRLALRCDKWFIFISTYQIKDRNIYGLSKLMGEELCRVYQKKGLKVRIIRLPLIYGKCKDGSRLVTKAIKMIKAGKTPPINTEDKISMVYIDDIVDRIEQEVAVMDGGSYKYTIRDLIDGIRTVLNEKKV